jgi:hypothetical protein
MSAPHVHVPTLGYRADTASRALTLALVRAGLLSATDWTAAGLNPREMIAALLQELQDAYEELYWMRRLPAAVLSTPVPTDDEADEIGEGGHVRLLLGDARLARD